MLANEDTVLQGHSHGSWEASGTRGLRCQGHQPPTHPGAVGQNEEGSPLWSPVEFAKGSFPLCQSAYEH